MSGSLCHEDKLLLFKEVATLTGASYNRDTAMVAWQKKSLTDYLFSICSVLTQIRHGGLLLCRVAGQPSQTSHHAAAYVKTYSAMQHKGANKHIIDVTQPLESIRKDIITFVETKVFCNPETLSDFNWFYVDLPQGLVQQKKNLLTTSSTVQDKEFEGQSKKLIYFDIDLKDQYALLKSVFPYTSDLDFRENVKNVYPREKIDKLIIEPFFREILETNPFDIVFTGNGFHCGYFIEKDVPWGTLSRSKNVSFTEFYKACMLRFSKSIVLDEKCQNPARIRRLPYTYNYKPHAKDKDPGLATLAIVLQNQTLNLVPDYSAEEAAPLFAYTQSFLTELTAEAEPGKAKKKKIVTPEEISNQIAKGSYQKTDVPYAVESEFKKSAYATSVLTKIRIKRDREKTKKWITDKPTFGEVFNYFGFFDNQSGYKPTHRGDTSFQFAVSPFRHKLGDKDRINISEETEGSFRYNDNNGMWFDFGIIPGYKGAHNVGDVFGLIYLLHVKVTGEPSLPDYVDEEGFKTIAELLEKILELDMELGIDTLLEVPEDPSRATKQGGRYLIENIYMIRAVAYNNFFMQYDLMFDDVSQEFLVRPKTTAEEQLPYVSVTDPESPLAPMLAHTQRVGSRTNPGPVQYFQKYTPVKSTGNLATYLNLVPVCGYLATETLKLLNPIHYTTENEELRDDYDNIIEQKVYKVYQMDTEGVPENFKYKELLRIPVVRTSHIILKFKGNVFFHVMEAREVTPEEVTLKYSMCRIVVLNDYFPRIPYKDMEKPLLEELLDPIFDIKGRDNSIVLRYILGCMFAPPNGKTRAVIMLDKGESGKSTFLAIFKAIFPPDVHTELNLDHIAGGGKGSDNTAVTARARLINKCIAFVSDLHNYMLPLGFKSYITGDEGAIDYRHLFQESKTMTNQALFLLMGNSMPKITDDYAAFSRRLIVHETKGRDLSRPTIVNLANEIVKQERFAFIRLMIESIIEFKEYDFIFPCEESEEPIGRYVPRAKELISETIRHIQNSSGLGMPMAPLYYAPGSVLNATNYTQLCVDYIGKANSKNSNNFMGQNDVGKFLVEMLSETARYSDRFMPEKYMKEKLPRNYPVDAPLLPVIFVKNTANELAYIINIAVDNMPALKGPGMEAPGSSITSRASTLTIDTLLETLLPQFNPKMSPSDSVQYSFVPAVSKGACFGKENTLMALVALGKQIKQFKTYARQPEQGNVRNIGSNAVRKVTRRPISAQPLAEPVEESGETLISRTGTDAPAGAAILDLDI
jgi:hypothetical protein